MKRGLAFALVVPLTIMTVARSQTPASINFLESADNDSASFYASGRSAGASSALQPDALLLANQILQEQIGSNFTSHEIKGGLWVNGDVSDALARLCWIVGPDNRHLLYVGSDNRVTLNTANLVEAANAIETASRNAPLSLASYISANEGLMLLLQITESAHRYMLHIGPQAPTADGDVANASLRNLDNNFDSRINPYRKNGVKLRNERPPEGFDSMVAINPAVSWLNLRTKLLVPPGGMAFHELAEAHAKVELGFDYLQQGSRPGAHELAIEREERLAGQRPFSDAVVTKGWNSVLTNTTR